MVMADGRQVEIVTDHFQMNHTRRIMKEGVLRSPKAEGEKYSVVSLAYRIGTRSESSITNNVDRTRRVSPGSLGANPSIEVTTGHYVSRPARAIFVAGLSCGILDITTAFVVYGRPLRLLQGIAYGLLGPQAFDGGWVTGMLGLACHFFVAFCASAVFYLAARRLKFIVRQAIPVGVAYGIVVYIVMQAVIIPLSRIGRLPFSLSGTLIGILIHIVCVGLPISLWMRRYSPYPPEKPAQM